MARNSCPIFLLDHLEKCGVNSDFHYHLKSFRLTANLVTSVADWNARALNMRGACVGLCF